MFRFSEFLTSADTNIFGGTYPEAPQLEPKGGKYFFGGAKMETEHLKKPRCNCITPVEILSPFT